MRLSPPECEHCKSRTHSLFHFCHLEEIADISLSKTCSSYKRGQIIFQEGANPIGLYCINKGKIKLSKYASDGRDQIVRIAKVGDFLGYSSLLGGTPYSVSALAMEDCIVCHIPRSIIFGIFKQNSRFSEGLIKLLCQTIDTSIEKMADLAYKPVRGRMAEALLLLYNAYKDADNPTGIINITREDLASLVGTVKETAIRVLREFKDDNLLTTNRSNIQILNIKGLVRTAEMYD